MNPDIIDIISASDQAALATTGPQGLNVVPISVFSARADGVYICHFFMNKTIENLRAEPNAAFTCWKGFAGVQLKGAVEVIEAGETFAEFVALMRERFPERTLLAVLRLTPERVYDVAPGTGGVQR